MSSINCDTNRGQMIVKDLSDRLTRILVDLETSKTSITNSYNNLITRTGSLGNIVDNDLQTQNEITYLNQQTEATERQFVEAQYKFKASGGKSRKQTLQEFILLFFFVAYALFTVSLIVYGRAVGISTLKIFGIMSIMLLVITGIIIRYA